jgi:hypothetical protein
MVEAARRYGAVVEPAYSDPRSRIHIDDAKAFFSAQRKTYDIIVSEPSNPWVSGVAGLFSEEFYRAIGRHLSENGIFCQWLQLYEIDEELLVSVLKALSENFDDFVIYAANNSDIIIIARNGAPVGQPDFSLLSGPAISGALGRIQISGPGDLLLRRIADRKLLGPFFEKSGMRGNSDYYPVLDQGAVRARFLRADATEMISASYRPLPLMELLGDGRLPAAHDDIIPSRDFARSLDVFTAMALRDYVLTGGFPEKYGSGSDALTARASGFRALFFEDCRADSQERVSAMYDILALQIVPFLGTADLQRIWTTLESGRCLREFSHEDRQWLELLKAVGRREGKAMAEASSALLEQQPGLPNGPMSYAVAVGMAGNLMQGKKGESAAIGNDRKHALYGTGRPPVFFRLLTALSSK